MARATSIYRFSDVRFGSLADIRQGLADFCFAQIGDIRTEIIAIHSLNTAVTSCVRTQDQFYQEITGKIPDSPSDGARVRGPAGRLQANP